MAGKNHTLELLEEGAFYCSCPREFDDPHDSQLGAQATGSQFDIDRWIHIDMEGIPEIMQKYELSRGVCLCFDAQHEFFQKAKPVLYTHSPVYVEYAVDSEATVDQMAYCKSLAWQFQKEWRIVFPGDEPKKVRFPKQTLLAVILGYRFPMLQFDRLKQILLNGGYTIEALRAERVPRSYELRLINLGHVGATEKPNYCHSK